MTLNELTGRTTDHLIFEENTNRYFHKDIYQDYLRLKSEALQQGIELYVLSSFRSFENQLTIWNKKARGERTLLDDDGNALRYADMSPNEVLFSILRWSALPGASRHHWGTDIDFVDKKTWPEGYDVQLIPSEFNEGGHFSKFRNWFDHSIDNNNGFSFFRPYQRDLQGVAPEMWHLSHKDISAKLLSAYSMDLFRAHLQALDPSQIELHSEIVNNQEEIYNRFVINIS